MSWETLFSVFVGAVVTWIVTWFYYKKAADDLRSDAKELRKLSSMMLTAMEGQGWASSLERDKDHNVTGWKPNTGRADIHLGAMTSGAPGALQDPVPKDEH